MITKFILIDAGHGGDDPGAIGPGKTKEKDITLSVATNLKEIILNSKIGEWTVAMVRKDDSTISVGERQKLIESIVPKPDVFISIHANASSIGRATGSCVYYHKQDSEDQKLSRAIFDNIFMIDSRKSKWEKVESDLVNVPGAGYGVLRAADDIPAALVEVGFITNPDDELFLSDRINQLTLAMGIFNGIQKYFIDKQAVIDPSPIST